MGLLLITLLILLLIIVLPVSWTLTVVCHDYLQRWTDLVSFFLG